MRPHQKINGQERSTTSEETSMPVNRNLITLWTGDLRLSGRY